MAQNIVKPDAFAAGAKKAFAFLEDHEFVFTSADEYRVLYTSPRFFVEILFDDRDGRLLTMVEGAVGRRNPRANLICLYREAGLGPAQDIREIARSSRTLSSAFSTQAHALDRLLPALQGERGDDLLLKCHGT